MPYQDDADDDADAAQGIASTAAEDNDPEEREQMGKLEQSVRDQMMNKWANKEKGEVGEDVQEIVGTENKEIALARREYQNDYQHMKKQQVAGKKISNEEIAELRKEKEDEEKEETQVSDERAKIIALMEEADQQIDMLKRNRSAFSPAQIRFLKHSMAKVEKQLRRMAEEEDQEVDKLKTVEQEDEEEADKEWKAWEAKQADEDRNHDGSSAGTIVVVVVLVIVMGASICIALIMVDKSMSAKLQAKMKELKAKIGGEDVAYSELGTAGDVETDENARELLKMDRASSESWTASEVEGEPELPDRTLF